MDISIKAKIRKLIQELNTQQRTTIILTTHDISDIEALCQRVIIIDKGKIIFDDPIQKVKTLFGAYRTLKLQLTTPPSQIIEACQQKLTMRFGDGDALKINDEDEWIAITINQDVVPLRDVLHFVMEEFLVNDVKITEIATEDVIQRIYDGGVQ